VNLTDDEFNDCLVKGDPCENLAEPEAWAVMKEVEARLREKIAQWMIERGYATGHGDTVEDLLKELEWQIREREREKCIEVLLSNFDIEDEDVFNVAAAIRARGESE
jgi:hypothetical protein